MLVRLLQDNSRHRKLIDTTELEKEREERKEGELSVAALDRQLNSIKEQCSLLDAEIEQRRAVVLNLRRGTSYYMSGMHAIITPFFPRTRKRAISAQQACRSYRSRTL